MECPPRWCHRSSFCQQLCYQTTRRSRNSPKRMQPQRFFRQSAWTPCSKPAFAFFLVVPIRFHPRHHSGTCVSDCLSRRTGRRMPRDKIVRPRGGNDQRICTFLNSLLTLAFFLPIMMGDFRCTCRITKSSWSHGWKNRCLIFEKRRSMLFVNRLTIRLEQYHKPILEEPIDWYLIPFWWISTSPGSRLPSVAGLTNTSGSLRGRRPFISTNTSCSMTSAISFFCCSRLVTSFFNSVICLKIVSKRFPSTERYVTERTNVASGSSKG